MDPLAVLAALAVGAAAGLLSGMFGIGGGVVIVPALLASGLVGHFNEATACSLLAIIFLSPTGSYVHLRARHLNPRYALALGASGVLGGVVGTLGSSPVPQDWLELAFGLFAFAMGVRIALSNGAAREGGRQGPGRGGAEGAPCPDKEDRQESLECRLRNPYPVLALLGFAAGVLAGSLGVGGGLIMVPVMIVLGVGVHVAIGTSLMAIVFTAGASAASKASLSLLPFGVAIPLALGGCAAAYAGAVLACRTRARELTRYLSLLQFVIGGYMLLRAAGLL
ncbi:MAG: sulfite exporter TauE/SafE family protein [Thermoplasmatota archaeon]